MSPKNLSRADILRTARTFRPQRKMPKWRVVVEDRELPARPLVLQAAGVPPNDPTNSHQAVAILEALGFEVRYASSQPRRAPAEENNAGGMGALLEVLSALAAEVPEEDWKRIPNDLSQHVDHYLYGTRRRES